MTLHYRPMTERDLEAAFSIRLSTKENAVTMKELAEDFGVTPEGLAQAMKADVKGWLCEADGAPVGFAMGDGSKGEVTVVAVLPGYERRGIGQRLLGHVRDWLFAAGHETIWLLANPDPAVRAYGFYRRLGWQAVEAREDGHEVMTLRKAAGTSRAE